MSSALGVKGRLLTPVNMMMIKVCMYMCDSDLNGAGVQLNSFIGLFIGWWVE